MLNKGEKGVMVFQPDLVMAAPGDTVTFVPTDKSHNAEAIKDMLPEGATLFKGKARPGTLTVRYERPTPIGQPLTFDAWVDRTEGRKVFTLGTISADGVVTARAEGVFVRVEFPVPAD